MNKKMMLFLLLLITSYIFADVITIEELQTNYESYAGQQVEIEGVVTLGTGLLHSTQLKAYIQDESGYGVQLFNYNVGSYANLLQRGKKIHVVGEAGEYNGTTQVVPSSITDLNDDVDDVFSLAENLSYQELSNFSQYEGVFTKFEGEITDIFNVGGGTNVTVTSNNQSLVGRIWDTTGVNWQILELGMPVTMYGVLSFYSGNSQLLPAYDEDIVINLSGPQFGDVTITSPAMQEYSFLTMPFRDEDVTISLRVYDYQSTITEVKVVYWTDNEEMQTELAMTNSSEDIFEATLPSLESLNTISEGYYYNIIAKNELDETAEKGVATILTTTRIPIFSEMRFEGGSASGDTLYFFTNINSVTSEIDQNSVYATFLIDYDKRNTKQLTLLEGDTFTCTVGVFGASTNVRLENITAMDIDGNSGEYSSYDSDDVVDFNYPTLNHVAVIKLESKVYNVYEANIPINIYSAQGFKYIFRIYNSEGKLVRTYNEFVGTNGTSELIWDAKDNEGKRVPIGLYIGHLETINIANGKKKIDKAPIVIGDEL